MSDPCDALNVHDDQFDASDALISTAVSLVATAALSKRNFPSCLIGHRPRAALQDLRFIPNCS